MKTLLLHISDDKAMEARLQVALDLARAFGTHITCIQSVSYDVFAPGDFYGSAMAAAMPVIKETAEKHRSDLEARLSKEDVSWDWRFLYGMPETHLLEQSSLADLLIVGPYDVGEDGRGPSGMVGNLVLNGAAPVLIIPETSEGFDVTAPALAGWNGSSEACAALKAAVPFLSHAKNTYLACIREEKDSKRFDVPPVDGAQYLSRYGIEPEIIDIEKGQAKVADTLYSAAHSRGCGLLVMGAFGHSRLAEMLLGGVTRRALTDPKMPVLIAH